MNSGTLLGKASISFSRPVYIQSCASVVGPKEGDGPLKNCFDMICDDPMFGEKKWEAAESAMQKEAAVLAIGKAGLTPDDIRFVFAGDLLAQTIASSFGIAEMGIPFFGLYGCNTKGRSNGLGEQVTSEDKSNIIRCKTGFSDRKNSGLFLHGTFSSFPFLFSEHRIITDHIKTVF